MGLSKYQRAFGVFSNAADAEAAIQELKMLGLPMSQVSAIAQPPAQAEEGNKAQEGSTIGAIAGGTVGGVIGLVVGFGMMAAIPGFGPIMLIGAATTALATTLTSGMIGATAGGLLGALVGYGIPEEQAVVYSDRIHRGEYLMMIEGSEAEVRQAEAILNRWNVQELRIYNPEFLTAASMNT